MAELYMEQIVPGNIAGIKPYEPGKPIAELEREYNISNAVKLASNENPAGFSPKVHEAVMHCLKDMNRYPESFPFELASKLAEKFAVTQNNIVIGNGSDDIIALLAHGFLEPGQEAVMPLPSFLMYEISVRTAKGVPVMVPLKDFSTNIDGILKAITPKTRMIFLTNPFNPTGSIITYDEFYAFMSDIPDNILVIVDEAYIEFVRDDTVYNSMKKPLEDPRIVTLRTFSKAYGLAGFRVGYGIMDERVAEILNRIRQPFNVNSLAQAAACAALDDEKFLEQTVAMVHEGIDYLCESLCALGLECLPTQSNFMMVDVRTDAKNIFEKMLYQGVIVRALNSYGFDTFLRINAGTHRENTRFAKALESVLKK